MPVDAHARSPLRVAIDPSARQSLPEVAYVIRTLLRTAGYPWRIEWADGSDEPVDIAYGTAAWSRARVRIPAVSWPLADVLERPPDAATSWQGIPLPRFPGEQWAEGEASPGHLEFPSDVLLACYWWLTGAYEKRCTRDRRDNLSLNPWPFIVQAGLLRKPTVSLSAALLRRRFEEWGRPAARPLWLSDSTHAAFAFTHDVDYPEIIRWVEIPRLLARRGTGGLRLATAVATGKSHFWKFADWVDLAEAFGTRPAFYFMARRGSLVRYALGTPDAFYDVGAPRFRRLFDALRRRDCEIGLHASYWACRDADMLRAERERIERMAGVGAIGNRHHYWHLDPDDPNETLHRHERAGLSYDSSLGLEFYPGFRRGICHPFRVFHPGLRRELSVVQVPPAWMDDHFDRRLTVNGIADPEASARALVDAARETRGVVLVDYHVRGMNGEFFPRYGPWLRRFAEAHLDSSLRFLTPAEIRDAYLMHERNLADRSSDRTQAEWTPAVLSARGGGPGEQGPP